MTLLLREQDVQRLLPMSEAVRYVRAALAEYSEEPSRNLSRRRIDLDPGALNVMGGFLPSLHSTGTKSYAVTKEGARFLVTLWDSHSGKLLALIEADWLGRTRTGAATGVATDLLANPDAQSLAVIGTGSQAQTQIEAVAAVRHLTDVRVFSRDSSRRHAFAESMSDRLETEVKAAPTAEAALRGVSIVVTITSSKNPVLRRSWLSPGTHVNAAGSNWPDRRELDEQTIAQASVVAVDSMEQARLEAGDLILAASEGSFNWSNVIELGQLLGTRRPLQYSSEATTVFKSLGVGVEDVAVARYVYEKALGLGYGDDISFGD